MSFIQTVVLVAFFSAAIAYPICMRLLARLSTPYHWRMFQAAEELSSNPEVSDDHKDFIFAMAKDARDWKFMVAAFVIAPFAVCALLLGLTKSQMGALPDQAAGAQFAEFTFTHIVTTACANPLFAVLFAIEFLILSIPMGISTIAKSPLRMKRVAHKICEMLAFTSLRVELSMNHFRMNRA